MSALTEMVRGGEVDFVTGDYLAEVTMMVLAKQRTKNPALGFAASLLPQIEPVLAELLERKIRVVVNAGGLNPQGLAMALLMTAQKLGLSPKVAMVLGDDLRERLLTLAKDNDDFRSLESGAPLSQGAVITANAYLGAFGITRALDAGADIVICPRVTDASLLVGCAAHWHGWSSNEYDALAGAVAAGHVIECGPQATGGNYSGFRALDLGDRPAFPLAIVEQDGSAVITKHAGQPGRVTVGTVTAQLVYEIASPRYANPDVVAHLDTLSLTEIAVDQVRLSGCKGSPPPKTTKVAITTRGVFRNEMLFAFVGLDIDEKIAWFERSVRTAFVGKPVTLTFQSIGSAASDAKAQDAATVLLRVVAESEHEALVSRGFSAALIELGLSSYPGLFALGLPGPASEATGYWPTLVRQVDVEHRVVLPDGSEVAIPPPPRMEDSQGAAGSLLALPDAPIAPARGETRRSPLGALVSARSGDKGSDANVGVWVERDDAYAWMVHALDIDAFYTILPEARGLVVERYELPNLRALNFVVRGLLAGGAIACARVDRQAKALGEFLRARHFDVPVSLLP